jgi:hypothetical protein
MKKDKAPGIKIRVAKDKHVQLIDRRTGVWLATVRWRPSGTMWLELAKHVRKSVMPDWGEG